MKLALFEEKYKSWMTFLEVERNVSPHTLRAYRADMKQLIEFWNRIEKEERSPEALVVFDQVVRRYVVALFYRKISKKSLARKLSCLRSFAHYLRRQGIDFEIEAQLPRIEKKLPIILSVEEISYILDEIPPEKLPSNAPYRDRTLFELIYATGARCSEIVSISLDDINFSEKTIKVLGKGRVERLVLFGEKAKQAINLYLEYEWRPLSVKKGSRFLFLTKEGTVLTPRAVQRIFEMFRSVLKVDRILTPHKLRHSFATHLLNGGADIRVVQELLGHRTLATTELYTQVSSAALATMCDSKHPLRNATLVLDDETLETEI